MPHVQVTLATLRTRLFERVDTSQHWENAEATIAINDALKLWNALTGTWRRQVTVTFTPASDPYQFLTGTMIWPARMELSDGTTVEKTSIRAIDLAIPGWEGQTTADGGSVPTTVQFWMPRDLQFFAVWPRPTVATSLLFDGVSETPTLSADGDFIDLDQGWHDHILNYAAHLLLFKDGGPKWEQTLPALEALVLAAANLNEEIRSTAIFRNTQLRDRDFDHRPRTRPQTQIQEQFRSQQFRRERATTT